MLIRNTHRSSGTRLAAVLVTSLTALAACSSSGPSEAEQIASAQALLAKQDSKGAVIELKNALQKNPKSAEARYLLGKTLLEAGDANTGLVELLKAQELQMADERVIPEIARAMLSNGEDTKLLAQYANLTLKEDAAQADLLTSVATAQARKNELDSARASIDKALRARPGFAPAVVVQASLAAAGGDVDSALKLLESVPATDASFDRAGLFRADLLLQTKRQPEAALAAYRQVLQAKPNSVMARAAMANILYQQGKLEDARVEGVTLKKQAPDHPETLLLLAQLAYADKDYKGVREICERVLKAMPNNLRILELAGAAEMRLGNHLQAEAHLGQALKLAPNAMRPRLLLAQSLLNSGQAEKTLTLLQPVIDSKNADPYSLSLAGEAYLQTGDSKRSAEAFKRATQLAPDNSAMRTTAAIAQLASGDSADSGARAIQELESVAKADTGTRADLALVSARLSQKDLTGALKAIDAVERKTPDKPLAHLLRGRVLLMKQDTAGAVKSFERALEKDAAYFPAVASLASVDLGSNQPDKARQRLDAYLKANPKQPQARLALAELQARTGAPSSDVVATLREATKINVTDPTSHLLLINRLLVNNDGKGALQAAQDATAALPNNLDLQSALGRAQMVSGDAQRALQTLKKLSSLQPRNATVLVYLADAYRANKDFDTARSTLKQALELQPDLSAARVALIGDALENKRVDEALTLARDLQKRSPKSSLGWQLEGEVEATRKNWDTAAAALRTAMQREPSATVAVKLHAALAAGNKAADADRLAADWLKTAPKDAVFIFYLGDVALARNDLAGAEARYRSVLELQPNNALALNNLAFLMAREKRAGAVAMAQRAIGLLPDRAPLLDTLSLAQEAENQLPQAIETQIRATRLQPQDGGLTLRLAKLYIKSGDKTRAKAELETLAKLGERFPQQAEVASLMKTL